MNVLDWIFAGVAYPLALATAMAVLGASIAMTIWGWNPSRPVPWIISAIVKGTFVVIAIIGFAEIWTIFVHSH